MARVLVSDIIEKCDMRAVHKLRDSQKVKQLTKGSCLVAFNKSMTIARIIDWKKGVHTYYAAKNEMFDITSLRALIKEAFYVELAVGKQMKLAA